MDGRIRALTRSVGPRLLVPLSVTVAAVLTVYAVVDFRATRHDFLDYVHLDTDRCSDLIKRATHDGMLVNQLDRVQGTLDDLAASPGIHAIRIYDKQGAIVLSADRSELDRRLDLESDVCLACHRKSHVAERGRLERSGLVDAGNGVKVLRQLSVIDNEPGCAATGCHPTPADAPVLGVLDLEMSVEPVARTLRATARRTALATVALIGIIGVVAALFIRHEVSRPVARLAAGTRRIARGELETRIDVRGDNELSRLADRFNRMAEELSAARAELTDWSGRLEEKVVEKTQELQRAQRQVQVMEKMASLGKLSATVAHELNNPMSAMLTYCRLISRELAGQPLDDTVRAELSRYLELLQGECKRCGDIVRNLLLFARRSGAQMTAMDVNDVVRRSVMLVGHRISLAGVRLEQELLPGDAQVVGDAGQIQQALVALLVNAVEAMETSGEDERVLTVRVAGTPTP